MGNAWFYRVGRLGLRVEGLGFLQGLGFREP